jgi:MFS transporter, ACS family, hexuronate transporter
VIYQWKGCVKLGHNRVVTPAWGKADMLKHKAKWLVLGMAFLATVINYLDRQTLSVMAPLLLDKFHISAEIYSDIIFAFMFAYTVMNGISGRLLDRLGSKVGYALTIAWWSGAEVLHAFSAGAFSLGFFRFLLGLGEAGNYPAGVKLIAEWFPAEERSLASGIFNSGAAIGAILAPPLVACILLTTGWRMTFVVIGLLGFVWLIVWIAFYRRTQSVGAKTTTVPFATLVRSRFLWQFTLSKVFSDPVWYFYTFWFPQYLKVVHNFSIAQIGATAWIPFFTAAIGNLAGGALFRGLLSFKTSVAITRRICVLLFSALMVAAVFVGGTRSAAACVALISVAMFGYCGALANLLAIPADVFPEGAVASVWGFASMGAGFGAMIFSLATGWLVDRYSFQPVFWLFGVLPIISAWIVWTLPKREVLASPV